MKLSRLLSGAGLPAADMDVEITGVTAGSDGNLLGKMFVLRPGREKNAENLISKAISNGASAVLTGKNIKASVPTVKCDNVRAAEARISAALYSGGAKIELVAVTGTNGKTTTASMLHHILSRCGRRAGLIGTVGAVFEGESCDTEGMTTPAPETFYRIIGEMSDLGADTAVFEASSQGIAGCRLDGLHVMKSSRLSAAIFTNLSPEHLDAHGTMEEYFRVKSSLFTEFSPHAAVINTDDAYGSRLSRRVGGVRVGTKSGDDFVIRDIAAGCGHVLYTLDYHGERRRVSIRAFAGAYNAYNSAAAAAAAVSLGIGFDEVCGALESFGGVPGRMEPVSVPNGFPARVYIDFAHTPAALTSLLKSAKAAYPEARIVVLFGCGGDRDREKRPKMGRAAAELADFAIVTSDNSRGEDKGAIINDILSGMTGYDNYTVIAERREAIKYALGSARKGDVIILAGKGHEKYEISNGIKSRFDEREEVESFFSHMRNEEK
ncbi:MAG: UDP-N-acetylmuramoyl-L-alanyl-D-glutamate--2,6-diaminopimelate ligase [Firmicutes bacterium]|nr:UDP-N-acetylmuramoyl-L-alanyl-D-glutamate--2,6-diaminopimelate ligase [Bacillota bacterium]